MTRGEMLQENNFSSKIEKQLPAELVEFMQRAGLVAAGQGQSLYLVGGVVRDLLLERTNLDLDLVVEGDAIDLTRQLIEIDRIKMTAHPRFRTANLKYGNWGIDITTARSEPYTRPGALPTIKPGSIEIDLFRRDFTINTMAIELAPSRWGEMIDIFGGGDDLKEGLIRVLHEGSFIDDATRIWRALRYEQRLGFRLEQKTLRLIKRDIPMLDTISNDRIRHELELVLEEEFPEKVFHRADRLKVLPELHPGLKGDGWLSRKFRQARKISSPNPPPVGIYLALLAYRLTYDETEKLISQLRLGKINARTLRDTSRLKAKLESLSVPTLVPSLIYSTLQEYLSLAISTNYLATDSKIIKKNINLYLTRLRYVKTSLTGKDLKKIGIAPGPRMKEILKRLLEARLDGRVKSKKGEVEMVKRLTEIK